MNRPVFFWIVMVSLVVGRFSGGELLAEQTTLPSLSDSERSEVPTPSEADKLPAPAPPEPVVQAVFRNSRQAELAILNALVEKSEANFEDTPFQQVVEFWQKRYKIPIALDRKALNELGITPETPVTLHLKEVSFRAILEQVLEQLDLTWTIRHESLWITTPEEVMAHLVSRVYAVDDLLAHRAEDPQGELNDLIRMITSSVKPQTWADVGGPASIAPLIVQRKAVMVVCQSWPAHLEIMQLLQELRETVREKPSESPPPSR